MLEGQGLEARLEGTLFRSLPIIMSDRGLEARLEGMLFRSLPMSDNNTSGVQSKKAVCANIKHDRYFH